MKTIIFCLLLLLLSLFCTYINANDVITHKVLSDEVNGLLAAFGDFNADKLTDVFFITNEGKTVVVYLAQQTSPILNISDISCTFDDYVITSVVPGDYNGDYYMDVLVTLKSNKPSPFGPIGTFVKILWGNMINFSNCTLNETELKINTVRDQPLVLDYNADKILDVYGETLDGQRQVWIMKNGTYVVENISVDVEIKIQLPHSNAFVDLNHDMIADIFVTSVKNKEKVFETWYNDNGIFNNYTVRLLPDSTLATVLGQSAFADFNADGYMDHVVPGCKSGGVACNIYVHVDEEWLPLIQPGSEKDKWNFHSSEKYPTTLRIGDFNLDGYPDVVTILKWTGSGILSRPTYQKAVVFENVPCEGRFKRCLTPQWNSSALSNFNDVVQVAVYDIHQDGSLDFILVRNVGTGKKKFKVEAVENSFAGDVCFLKVLVVSGLCYDNCPKEFDPYGVNQPGPTVTYNTTGPDGDKQHGCAAQLPQSAYFALQLPYTVFGLGQTPNFVDSLGVGLPKSTKKEKHTNVWPFIIPNSQVVIIPLERKNADYRWMLKLFVTPSHQVLMTFIALSGTCLLVALLIGGLHWKEKAEDKREKLVEAHRFHFDAM